MCRKFAKGTCTRGKSCKYLHPDQPGNTSTTTKFKGNCHYCNKYGHRIADCHKKKRDEKGQQSTSGLDKSNASVEPPPDAAPAAPAAPVQDSVQFGDRSYPCYKPLNNCALG